MVSAAPSTVRSIRFHCSGFAQMFFFTSVQMESAIAFVDNVAMADMYYTGRFMLICFALRDLCNLDFSLLLPSQ